MLNKLIIWIAYHNRQALVLGFALIFIVVEARCQAMDTLPNIKVRAISTSHARVVLPYQYLGRETIFKLNSLSVADAVKFFPGVIVRDYGGIGGLKTISVRSLGANSTAIMYDGILLSDAQNGQIDLGKISVDNIDNIGLYSAQPADLLMPARTFSAASVLALKSTRPAYNPEKSFSGRISLKAGSFGFISPSLFLQIQSGKHFYQQLSTEFQHANGKYKFKGYEVGSGRVTRNNAEVNALRLEYDAGYSLPDSGMINFKSYYYNSSRGLPGAVVLYNSQTREKLSDENFFVQSSWRKNLWALSSLLFNFKYSLNNNTYADPDFPNSQGGIRSNFRQDEYYISGVYGRHFTTIAWSYGTDLFVTTLKKTDGLSQAFANPTRTSLLNNLSAKITTRNAELTSNLLYSRIADKVKTGTGANNIDAFSPTFALAIFPFESIPLRVRAFYKSIFRVPTFNDLYYTYIGNTSLRPEYAKQYNVGLSYTANGKNLVQAMLVTTDFYVNRVTDKILAVPRQNLFQWTMMNIGKVDIKGIDAAVQLYSKNIQEASFTARLSYTYQRALDKSVGSSSYNNQLPYTPEHSGSITCQYARKKLNISYNVILSGYRYRLGEQTHENLVKEWVTHDISVSYKFSAAKKTMYRVTAEANNIFDRQYEVIRFYPMPGFNFRVGLTVQF